MTKDEALDLALEALKELVAQTEVRLFSVKHDHVALQNARQAITAIKQARSAPVQKRPQNCGTGYCSCVECVMEPAPVQEPVRGWWAHTSPITGITDVQDWQLTEDDKARGWIEREIYTTPPAAQQDIQRLSALVRAQQITIDKLEQALAAPVRADEREACAKVCDDGYDTFFANNGVEHNRKRYDQQAVERAIRAAVEFVTADCAAAIRARGNT